MSKLPGNEPVVLVAVVPGSEIVVEIWRIAWTKEQAPNAGFAVEESNGRNQIYGIKEI